MIVSRRRIFLGIGKILYCRGSKPSSRLSFPLGSEIANFSCDFPTVWPHFLVIAAVLQTISICSDKIPGVVGGKKERPPINFRFSFIRHSCESRGGCFRTRSVVSHSRHTIAFCLDLPL